MPNDLAMPATHHPATDGFELDERRDSVGHYSRDSASQTDYEFDCDTASEQFSPPRSSKKKKSGDLSLSGVSGRFGPRLPSLSKRWKHKSAAGPQLSIVTPPDHAASRTGSANSSQLISPALSAISKHESHLPPSPVRANLEDSFNAANSSALEMEQLARDEKVEPVLDLTPILPLLTSE